ncbi:MAG: hypothetical protein ACE5G8_06805, partial [Anaerolineae bacterium]
LQHIADQGAQAVDEAAKSPAASEVKTEVKRAAGEMKELGGKVYSEAKPHLLSTLKTLGESIQTIIERLEASAAHEGEPEPEAAPPKNGD